ncbi:hypothetical protein MAPG_09939 [Magnaporthiopsis poae ATCC 64411]|uniref:Uncharacterized protein n=1 Tax=Magnaporthiopsis poae (strain ATCC 64411 / 73-15) TaxID=644358 RepID=A0A0C4EB92_MAGP6|nr:hypothetical protein MAPG_09939 [Magnaporthiopsis poae ATCC 64411]
MLQKIRAHDVAERLQMTHPPTQRALARLAVSRSAAADDVEKWSDSFDSRYLDFWYRPMVFEPPLEPYEEQIQIEDVTMFDDISRSSFALYWFLRYNFDPSKEARSLIPWYWGERVGELERCLFSGLWPMTPGPRREGSPDRSIPWIDEDTYVGEDVMDHLARRHPTGYPQASPTKSKETKVALLKAVLDAVAKTPGPAHLPMAAAVEVAYAEVLRRRRAAGLSVVPTSSEPDGDDATAGDDAAAVNGEKLTQPSDGSSNQSEIAVASSQQDEYVLSLASWSQPFVRDPFLFDDDDYVYCQVPGHIYV